MTHIIRPTVPAILRRAFDAFGANDATTIGEAFEPNAVMTSHVDERLLRLFGPPPAVGADAVSLPLRARGHLQIAHQFGFEFQYYTVAHTEVHSAIRAGREVAAVCDFEIKLNATGDTIHGRCTGMYTLNSTGRLVENARTVCQLITPGWDHKFN